MVHSMMADLHGSEPVQDRNPGQKRIEAIVRDVRVPVRNLIGDEVQQDTEEKGRSQPGIEQDRENRVVDR